MGWDGAGNDNEAATQVTITYDATGAPEIAISSSESGAVADGGSDAQGDKTAGMARNVTYTVDNSAGTAALTVTNITTGNLVNVTSANPSKTSLTVAAGATDSFTVTYIPTEVGAFSFDLDINSNDADENPYDIAVSGTAVGGIIIDPGDGTPTSTIVTIPSGTLYAGENITLTATVSGDGGTPTGTVTFVLDGQAVGTAELSGGQAVLEVSGGGWNTIENWTSTATKQVDFSAVYAGDDVFAGGQSPAQSAVFNRAPTTTSLSAAPGTASFGDPVTFTATINSPSTASLMAGYIGFYDGDILLHRSGRFRDFTDGMEYSFTTSLLSVGAHNITARLESSDGTSNYGRPFYNFDKSASADMIIEVEDTVPPTLAIQNAPASFDSLDPFSVTFKFNEDVTGFELGDITLGNGTASNFATTDAETYTADITPSGTGDITIDVAAATAQDLAGNDSLAASTVTVLTAPPAPSVTISGVPATTNAPFTATFTFSEDVTGFAVGDITVGNGAASAFSGSGTTYTALITPAADGQVTIDVAAGVAKDNIGNDNTAATQATTTYEGTAPTVTISGHGASYNAPFTATFTFSESVTGFEIGDIFVGVGTASNLAGSGTTYTALITPDADGQFIINVVADAAQDSAGNGNPFHQIISFYDGTAPSVAISGVPATSNAPFTATFTFSEDVTGFELGDITLGNGTASAFSGSGTTYTALITPAADGEVTIDVAAAVAQDTVGNDNTAATQATTTYDGTAPTVAISGVPATTNAPFTATFTFSEDVTGFELGDITLGNGTASAFSGSGTTYTALITPTADGQVTIDVAAAVAQDAVGNDNTAATQATTTYDGTAPTVAISGVPATTNAPFTATFTFSEDVTGFELGDITLGNGAASAFSGSGTTYTALITPAADGQVTIDVAAAVAQDSTGNDNTAATQATTTYDGTAPTVAISGVPATTNAPFTATFTFSEDVTGFELGDITLGNGTASAFAGSGTTYTALITPAADGEVTIDVAAAVAHDSTGNDNTAATQATTSYDGTPPTVEIKNAPASVTSTAPFNVTFEFSEGVTGFEIGDIRVSNGVVSNFSSGGFGGGMAGPSDYIASITPDGGGDITIDVAAAVAQDGAGNDNTAATQVTVTYIGKGTIKIVKVTSPALAGNDTFTYSANDADLNGISLTTVGNTASSATFAKLASSYTLSEDKLTSWRLDSIVCSGDTDGGSTVDVANRKVTIDLDGAEAIVCTFTSVRDEDYVRTRTKRVIGNFMARRADQITAAEPDLVRRLNKNGGGVFSAPVGFTGSGTLANNSGSFSTSLRQIIGSNEKKKADKRRELGDMMAIGQHNLSDQYGGGMLPGFDVWVEGKWAHSESDTKKTELGLLFAGVEYKLSNNLLLGVMGQMDWTDEKDSVEDVAADGKGWMIGPYMVARLHDNLLFDGRIAWGQSANHVNPLGLYTDSFDTSRWLARGQLTGDFAFDNWRFSPHVGMIYFEEEQKGYIDSLGIGIPGQTVALGRMTFGPKISYSFKAEDGTSFEPHIGIKGIWDFQRADIVDLDTGAITNSGDDLRARVEGGLSARFSNGWSLSGEGFYDGIGADSLEAYGGSVKLSVPLN